MAGQNKAKLEEALQSIKHDAGKPRYDLIAPSLLEEVAKVLEFGARKYNDRNWERPGFNYGRPFASAMRHLWAWWGGQDNDPESGFSHLAHAASCIMMLLEYSKSGAGRDDRPKAPVEDEFVHCTCENGDPWDKSDEHCPAHGAGSGWTSGGGQ